MNTRIESDSLGERKIPADALYGCQTDRAIENFPISGLRAHPAFIEAFILLKKAAAVANAEAKSIAPEQSQAIVQACDEILAGQWREHFVVDVFQMGAGTSFHMNVNEVLANRANQILGGELGKYDKVDPNNHVNFGQSTNDAFPTAMRLAALLLLKNHLHEPLTGLEKALLDKGKQFDKILKSARTHLQDAVPIRLGQEFAAYGMAIRKCHAFLGKARVSLTELGMGGSAAGTGLNTAPGYRERLIELLIEYTGIKDLKPAEDMREAMQSQRPLAEVSAALRNLALEVGRIANDLRLLSSGPTTGFAEIDLPATAPGSSIMPGKVNPSMLEMTNMVCFQVVGCDNVIAQAVAAGQLELNVMMPVMTFNLNFMIHILGNCLKQLCAYCVEGITANEKQCKRYAEGSMGLATALNVYIGYRQAAQVAKDALKSGKTIIEIIRERKILTDEEIARIMDPIKMTEPGIPGK